MAEADIKLTKFEIMLVKVLQKAPSHSLTLKELLYDPNPASMGMALHNLQEYGLVRRVANDENYSITEQLTEEGMKYKPPSIADNSYGTPRRCQA
jgi:hypothetical protein